jgi:hypothetical protein
MRWHHKSPANSRSERFAFGQRSPCGYAIVHTSSWDILEDGKVYVFHDAHTVKFSLKHPTMTLLPAMAATIRGFSNVTGLLQALGQGGDTAASGGDGAVQAR